MYLTGRGTSLLPHGIRGMRSRASALLLATLVALVGCKRPEGDAPQAPSAPPGPPVVRADSLRPGIRFDPATIRRGDQVGTLTVDSVAVTPAFGDSTLVGTIRFAGELELSGTTLHHFETDARDTTHCFEADSASAARMPRWSGDERRPWFCFGNSEAATRLLGTPTDGEALTVTVRGFTIHRGFSDQVNAAELVSATRPSSTP